MRHVHVHNIGYVHIHKIRHVHTHRHALAAGRFPLLTATLMSIWACTHTSHDIRHVHIHTTWNMYIHITLDTYTVTDMLCMQSSSRFQQQRRGFGKVPWRGPWPPWKVGFTRVCVCVCVCVCVFPCVLYAFIHACANVYTYVNTLIYTDTFEKPQQI